MDVYIVQHMSGKVMSPIVVYVLSVLSINVVSVPCWVLLAVMGY